MAGVAEHLHDSREAMKAMLKNRSLRRINLALMGSVVGDWAYAVALAIFAYDRGGATVVGVVAAARYVAVALLAPVTSVLADKFDRRRVMVAADLLRFVLVGAAAALVITDGPALPVYALSLLVSCVGTVFRPAQSALIPSLAETPGELTAANATASTIHSVGFFAGPAIAGLLLLVADLGSVLIFDALTFLWSAALVMGVHVAHREPAESDDAGEADGAEASSDEVEEPTRMLDGYRTMVRNRDLRLVAMLYVAQTVVAGASNVYEVAIVLELLHLGDSGLGVMNSVLGVGGVLGGGLALVLAQRGKLARNFGLGVTLWGAPLLLVAAWPSIPTTVAAMLLIGLGNSVTDVNAETILQRLVPDEVLGRVFGAIDGTATAGMALGAVLMPVLISTLGLRVGLLVVGVAVPAIVLLSLAGLRRIDRVALAPAGLTGIQGVPMLAVLPEHTLERLARLSTVLEVTPGDAVMRQGEVGDRFYIIEKGTADVEIDGVRVAWLSVGDSFGEIALLRDVPRTATVTATSSLRLRAIDRKDFLPAVTGHVGASEQADLVVGRLMDDL